MYGCEPKKAHFNPNTAFDISSYQAHLRSKLAELRDFVELNLSQAAHSQKSFYDNHSQLRSFRSGTTVWLSVPTAGKFEPRWEGSWTVRSTKTPVSIEITDALDRKPRLFMLINCVYEFSVNRMRHSRKTQEMDIQIKSEKLPRLSI